MSYHIRLCVAVRRTQSEILRLQHNCTLSFSIKWIRFCLFLRLCLYSNNT